MADLLVALYRLPGTELYLQELEQKGVHIRRAMAYERRKTIDWVARTFGDLWADECATAFGRQPVGCLLAVNVDRIVGFSCLETTFKNFVGPIGVAPEHRVAGVGRGLLLMCLKEMEMAGYAYAVVGDAGEPAFFKKVAGASAIEGSTPGPYPQRVKLDVS